MCVGINTEPTITQVQATQVKPETPMVNIQVNPPTMDQEIQTEKVNTPTSTVTQTDRSHQKSTRLGVQILPQINISHSLTVQRILDFSITPDGNTQLLYESDRPNVLFVEVTPSEEYLSIEDYDFDIGRRPTILNVKQVLRSLQSINDKIHQSNPNSILELR